MQHVWLITGLFLVLTVSSGFGFYNISVYVNALTEARGLGVSEVSGAVALYFLVGGVGGVGVARLIELYDVRWVMVGGAAICGASLSLLGFAREAWHVWALFVVFGLGNTGVSLIPATTVVTRFFPGSNRSVVLSVVSTGLSAGGVLLTPACAVVIQMLGVDAALKGFGVFFFVAVAPFALFFVRSWPDEATGAVSGRDVGTGSVGAKLRSRFFIGSSAAYVLLMAAQVGSIAHLFNHSVKIAGHTVAATAVSALAMSSIVGRLAGGLIVTRFPIRVFTLINAFVQGGGLLLIANATTAAGLLTGVVILGITVGNLLMLQPLLMADAFGVRDYSRIYSAAYGLTTIGVAGGPLAMGLLFDAWDYLLSFTVASVTSVLACAVFWSAGALPRPDLVQRETAQLRADL